MIQTLRRSLERQEGQALVMACLMVLVLTIAVLTTVNIGHTVHERIRLQNNADATAYSMAAMEARAFNFYSFANRTQVSHYVGAMVWQSLDSFIFFLEAFLTDIFGVMVSLDKCADPPNTAYKIFCKALENIPYVGPILKFIDTAISLLGDVVKAVQGALKNDKVDQFLAWVVKSHRDLNKVLDAASVAMMYSALQHLADPVSTALGSVDVIAAGVAGKNDPNLGKQFQQIPLAFLNACYFDRAHFREAGGSPFDPGDPFKGLDVTAKNETDKTARAKRTMAQISNATRFGCDTSNGVGPLSALCPDGFVTDRRPGSFIPKLSIFGSNVLSGLSSFLDEIFPNFWGQTRLLSYKLPFGKNGYDVSPPGVEYWKKKGHCGFGTFHYKQTFNRIRDASNAPSGAPMGMLAQGDNMGADDIYSMQFPPANWIPAGFPPGIGHVAQMKNPFSCDKDDDWKKCWGDPRALQPNSGNPNKHWMMPMKTSVWALNDTEAKDGGVHWRESVKDTTGGNDTYVQNYGLNKYSKCVGYFACFCVGSMDIYVANVEPKVESWHQWNGIVRFPHFEPGQYDKACLQGLSGARNGDPSISDAASFANDQGNASSSPGDFNQPSEWVLFHKDPANMRNPAADETGATTNNPALLNDKGELTFHFSPTGQKLTMDDQKDTFGFVKGVTAISRAQTYYHRPGNWNEQPNFFNPYWRPRLASVWQGRKTLPFIGDMVKNLPGPLKAIPQKVITH